MEGFLTVNLVPSLQHITAARICITFYIRDNLVEFLGKHPNPTAIDEGVWTGQKTIVRELISLLGLPTTLKRKVLNFTDDIGNELLKWLKTNDWLQYRPDYGNSGGTFPLAVSNYIKNCLVWTSRGTIQYEETAENILRSEHATKEEKFHLACAYCFPDILRNDFVSELRAHRSLDSYDKKPLVCYWTCCFFPEKLLTFKIRLGLSKRCNIDRYMIVKVKNSVALKHFFDKLDDTERSEVIVGILPACDFRTKAYLLSEISNASRNEIFELRPFIFLENATNILWQDFVLYYFNVCESFVNSRQCLTDLQRLLPYVESPRPESVPRSIRILTNYESNSSHDWRKSILYDVWSCLSENFTKEMIILGLSQLLPQWQVAIRNQDPSGPGSWESIGDGLSSLVQILMVLVYFNDNRLIDEMLRIAENETTKLVVSDSVPENQSVFSINDESFKYVMYYPRKFRYYPPLGIYRASVPTDKRLYLVHELILSKFPNVSNPLKNERVQEDIVDVFVEYCRCNEVNNIDKILDYYFENTSEKTAYKSSLLGMIFNKLLTKAVNESFYYFGEQSNRDPWMVPILANAARRSFGGVRNFDDDNRGFLFGRRIVERNVRPRLMNYAQRILDEVEQVERANPAPRDESIGRLVIRINRDPVDQNVRNPGLNFFQIRRQDERVNVGHINMVPNPVRRNHPIRVPRLPYMPLIDVLRGVNNDQVLRQANRIPVIYNSDDSDIIFSGVDAFLSWYFSSAEQINDFKTEAISNERIPIVEELINENKTLKLKKLLPWFFSNDERKIGEFKSTCQRSELTSLL